MLTGTWPIFAVNTTPLLPVNSRPNKGLALLGLTALIAFLVIMLVVIVVMASWVRKTGKEKLTRSTLESLASAVMVYNQATGQFPPTVSSNAQLLDYLNSVAQARRAVDAMPPYVFRTSAAGREILDGWARPVTYCLEPTSRRPELISKGPDSQDPTDDIYAQGLRLQPQ